MAVRQRRLTDVLTGRGLAQIQAAPWENVKEQRASTLEGKRILVIDDDPDLVGLLVRVLTKEGAQVSTAFDGQAGLRQFHESRPHLVILDVSMPVMDGLETVAVLQFFPHVPVILLSALAEEGDVVRGLRAGAVDYVTKPFSVKVLVARAQAALRRAQIAPAEPLTAVYDDGHLRVDLKTRGVSVSGEPLKLSKTEYRLLAYLLQNAGHLCAHRQILENVWGQEYRDCTQYVHVYAWHLRRKIEPDPQNPRYLLTEHGVGYRFRKHGAG